MAQNLTIGAEDMLKLEFLRNNFFFSEAFLTMVKKNGIREFLRVFFHAYSKTFSYPFLLEKFL